MSQENVMPTKRIGRHLSNQAMALYVSAQILLAVLLTLFITAWAGIGVMLCGLVLSPLVAQISTHRVDYYGGAS
ncbi:MAG: hypothetical protein OJJ54_23860 [Pseudonocardia sp.]|nr:hypothetical protein [Pseudonocardia sp.]